MISENDKSLFRNAIDDQLPIDKDGDQEPKATNTHFDQPFESYSYLSEANISGSEIVSYAKDGVSPKIIKKMKRGNIDHAPSLDLHGQTVQEACQSLSQFLHYHRDERFIQIIHGKGYHSSQGLSIIKSQVVHYLKQHPQILAFCSCPQKDGGTGAVFACLKADV
jgi:DNA-nicking Smr family endonuclease